MSNKMALDALTAAQRAINSMKVEAETAGAGGDQEMLQDACEQISNEGLAADTAIRAAIAALQAKPKPEADMFWDGDDGESFGHSIQDLIAERDVGEVVTVDRAMRLPSIKVRVISGETDEDDNTWEEVLPATPPKD